MIRAFWLALRELPRLMEDELDARAQGLIAAQRRAELDRHALRRHRSGEAWELPQQRFWYWVSGSLRGHETGQALPMTLWDAQDYWNWPEDWDQP